MMKYPYVKVDIYENDKYPVVTHIFYGKSSREAYDYFQAHMETDKFLKAAVLYRKFQGMLLHVEISKG